MIRYFSIVGAAVVLVLSGCSKQPATPGTASTPGTPAPEVQTFFVRGVVQELKPDGRTVIIDHEEIPNYMVKMTMPFRVKDTNHLAGIAPQDQIHFRLVVSDFESWIDQITRTGKAPAPEAAPTRRDFRPVREVAVLNVGDPLPNYPFTNQLGQAIQTGQFKGSALAITFVFTRCPLPDFCPRMNNNFAEAHQKLSARPGGPKNWHLLTLSFDPQFDTPAVLAAYARRYPADQRHWTFATGALIEIDDLTERFGLTFARDQSTPTFNHNLRTVVVDAAGRVQRVLIGNEWKADELVAEMTKAAAVK